MNDNQMDHISDRLRLTWDASVFFPEVQKNIYIQEVLKIEDYSSGAEKTYWSVPEHLVDIRWAISRIGQKEMQHSPAQEHISLEFKLHRIVTELWRMINHFDAHSDTIINEEKMTAAWSKLKEVKDTLIQPLADNPISDFTEDEISKIIDIARLFQDGKFILDERGKALAKIAKDITKIDTYDDNARGEIKSFAKKLRSMMDDPEWQKESTARKEVEQIIQTVAMFVDKSWTPNGLEWSHQYMKSIREGIFETVDIICKMINSRPKAQYFTMGPIMDTVDDILKKLHKNNAPEALMDYMSDKRRCIALLETFHGNSEKKYMAFSGFLDCCGFKCAEIDSMLDGYRAICDEFECELITLCAEVRECISRYGLNESLELIQWSTLRQECNGSACRNCENCAKCKENHDKKSKDKEKSRLKSRYSCCERKIIAHLQQTQCTTIDEAIMHVKFEPCLSCYGALKIWKKGIKKFTLDYIPFEI